MSDQEQKDQEQATESAEAVEESPDTNEADVLTLNGAGDALAEAKREAEDWRARAYRAAADLDNARKRFQKERDDLKKYGAESLLRDLLPVVDNLERALEHSNAGDSLAEGVSMVLRQCMQALAGHGATPFESKGEPFDPQLHEAMSQVPTADQEPGTVVDVFQRGWKFRDRLARPAMVTIATAIETDPEPETVIEEAPTEEDLENGRNEVDEEAQDVKNSDT